MTKYWHKLLFFLRTRKIKKQLHGLPPVFHVWKGEFDTNEWKYMGYNDTAEEN